MKKHLLLTLALAACAAAAAPHTFADDAADAPAVSAIPEKDIAFYDNMVERYTAETKKLLYILRDVKDKKTADAAAAEAQPVILEMDRISSSMRARCGNSPMVLDALADRYQELTRLTDKVDGLCDKWSSQEPPFFGSQALMDLFYFTPDIDDDEADAAPLTQEQKDFYRGAAKEMMAAARELKAAVSGITDKASADAAAPKVAKAAKRLANAMAAIRFRDDYTDAVDEYLDSEFPEGKGCMDDIMEIFNNLADKDFYHSEALEDAMMLGD